MREQYPALQARSIEVLAIGPDSAERFADYWRKADLPFPGLADPSRQVLALYGQRAELLRLGRLPAGVLVDHEGSVRAAHYGSSMADLPSTEDLTAALEGA